MKKLVKKKRVAKKTCAQCGKAFRTKGDICEQCAHDFEMQESGRNEIRALFGDMVHGQIGLAEFATEMNIDPDLIGSRIVFSPLKRIAQKPALPTKVLLCRVGQVDGLGHEVTRVRLEEIADEYRLKGVDIEVNSAGEVWATGSVAVSAEELFRGKLPENFSMGVKGEGDGTEKAGT